jgi:G3E family GTPase
LSAGEPGAGDPRVPVTLLTGFLGAGKTTLLNRLLQSPDAGRIACVVNEFGELGLDAALVVGADEEVVELRNGCLCCTVRGDLVRTVGRLLDRRRSLWRRLRFDRLVVELSGLATPGPVVQTFLLDDRLRRETRVDGVIAVVNVPDLERDLAQHPELAHQLGHADRVLLNHSDRAEPDVLERATRAAAALCGLGVLQPTVRCQVDLGPLLDLRRDDPDRWRLAPAEPPCAGGTGHVHGPRCFEPQGSEPLHTSGIETLGLESSAALDLHRLKVWLQFVTSRRDGELLRLKGLLHCRGEPRAVVAHGVHQWLELGPGERPAPKRSRLVLIGRGLDREALRRGFERLTADD